jgi:histidyl-tRNA synthetase
MHNQPLPGFRDFYPAEFAFRAHLFDTWRQVCRRYGFEEFDGPPLEPLELYTAKSGDEIVGQLYHFTDKGGREISLRPELTPTLARMVAARAGGMKKPIRWFSIGQMFRYERQQRGRLREFFQLNCDLLGESGPLADAELIALSIDLMRAFGLGPGEVRVRLSDRRVLQALLRGAGVAGDQLPAAYGVIDKLERMKPEQVAEIREGRDPRFGGAGQGILEAAGLRGWPTVQAALARVEGGPAAGAPLGAVLGSVEAMGLAEFVDLDLSIVRGLAYYTGTVFELFDAGRSLRAIAGGGRYDELLKLLGGADLPAVGFAIGDVVLGELLRERNLLPPAAGAIDLFIAGVGPEDQPHVLRLAHQLRAAGVRVEFALRDDGLGKQLKLADTRQALLAVVIGPDDRARGEVQLKDLRQKRQEAVPLADLVRVVKTRIAAAAGADHG